MGVSASFRWSLYILILPLVCQFGCKNTGQCAGNTVNYHCTGDKLMLVRSAYSCSDERCSKKLYDSVDVQDVWSTCNMRNTCDVTVRHHFLIMHFDCVLPDAVTKGDVCAAEKLILTPGSAKFFLHNPGYPERIADEVTCTCLTNLSQPVSVTMRYLQADIPDESFKILWDNVGGSPNGSTEMITPKRTLELVYQHSNLSSFWIQISVNDSVELFCENEYPIVILPSVVPTQSSAVLTFGLRIWIILGATSGVICIFIILVPIMVIFLCRHRKRRAAKLRAWNEMVEKATLNPATTIQRGTDRIRKVPKDGKTINLYQSIDEALSNGETMEGDGTLWTLVTPSKRRPGALSLNRPPPKQRSLPPEPVPEPKDTPYYIYETLPKDGKKGHPYQAIDELESGEEDSIGQMRISNDSYESKERLDKGTPDDDWSDLYQMASTLGRDSASPENDQWTTNDIYKATNLRSGADLGANTTDLPHSNTADLPNSGGGTARLPPSRSPNSGKGVLNPPDSGRGTLDPPSFGGRIEKSPQSGRVAQYRPDSLGGTSKLPYSTGGTAKFPYFPPGDYDNARDIKSKPDDSSGYDNCEPSPDPEEWLREKEREKAELEAAFLDIGKTLSRVKGDINAFKSLKNTHKKAKPKPSSPEDVYEFVS